MKRRPSKTAARPATRQPTPAELTGKCLSFLQRKFYEGHGDTFAQDRQRLLKWVVLYPAQYLNEQGVTLPLDRYQQIFESVFMDAAMFQKQEVIRYLPGYLAIVMKRHFDYHGEEYYNEGKSIRAVADHVLLTVGQPAVQAAPDPIRDLARAARLLKAKTKGFKQEFKDQLNLL